MSAIPDDFIQKTASLSAEITRPFTNSKKVYITGSRPDIRVGMREIQLSDTPDSMGFEKNLPFTVYDTSGPFTDPDIDIDLMKGIPDVRSCWIAERDDTRIAGWPQL